eukprot:NODE_3166_length_1267_cov_21.944930_g3007_i0.p1 GENE.NODE_3166_length_1267_cov_21.944930_g3007_i0~~NODE_3166_length_1267_cov_21.944930_g3007_i0.p1  ORF type:complete len:372 (+),score=11.86 NODE_3166_length_1267_cov_21.944930_g3007_i0:64-1179(+)
MWPYVVSAGLLAAYVRYYLTRVAGRPQIFVRPDCPFASVVHKCPDLVNTFYPTFWCAGAHAQTLVAVLGRNRVNVHYTREMLAMPDGGSVALDWSRFERSVPGTTPLLIILHGVTGGSSESYVTSMVAEANKNGWDAVVFNQRGCADSELSSPRAYCAAVSDDLTVVVTYIHQQAKGSPLLAVGYSMDANVLVKYLGEAGASTPISAAVSMGNPLDCLHCANLLKNSPFGRNVYGRAIVRNLQKYVNRHKHILPPLAQVAEKCSSVWDFDDRITSVHFDFGTAENYYREASSSRRLSGVRVPLLCVNAEDDPLAPARKEYNEMTSPHVILATTKRGGHLGWLEGAWPFSTSWSDRVVSQFLAECLDFMQTK